MKAELTRRHADTAQVLALFQAHEGRYLHWRRFFAIAPCAWRTRISDARKIVRRDGGDIEWNKNIKRSGYRYRRYALGRSAETLTAYRPQPLFELHRSGWQE